MTPSVPRTIAACSGLAAFAVATFAGLAVGNDALSIILRALLSMALCWLLGMAVGIVGMKVVQEHVSRRAAADPAPDGDDMFMNGGERAPADADVIEV